MLLMTRNFAGWIT